MFRKSHDNNFGAYFTHGHKYIKTARGVSNYVNSSGISHIVPQIQTPLKHIHNILEKSDDSLSHLKNLHSAINR